MKHNAKRAISLLLVLATVLSLSCVPVLADSSVKTAGEWYYTATDTEATVVASSGTVKNESVILFPAEVDGLPVTTIGGGSTAVITNANGWVVIPEGVKKISTTSFYDLNRTPGWSFPSTLTAMEDVATASCGGTFYVGLSAAAKTYAEGMKYTTDENSMTQMTVSAGDNGSVYPNGTYNLPAALVSEKLSSSYAVTADIGYKIDTLTVNGTAVAEAAGQTSYEGSFTVTTGAAVSVTFTANPDDTRTADSDPAASYVAPSITTGAVSSDASLPDDVYDYVADIDGEGTNKYTSTMGAMTGTYYTIDGTIYQMVYITQNVEYRSKAELINAVYAEKGWVYGTDYDYIRLYNYVHDYQNGPRPGNYKIYGAYLYKSVGSTASDIKSNDTYEAAYEDVNDDGTYNVVQGDVATLMVQKGAQVTVNNLISHNNTIPYGPSEACNFYGLGSAVLVDGGDTDAKGKYLGQIRDYTDSSTSSVVLNNPTIEGAENVIFAVAGGVGHLSGGRYFGATSGGHGLYVALGGQITLNSNADNGILTSDGTVNTDYDYLVENVLDTRPGTDLGTAVSSTVSANWNSEAQPEYTSDLSAYASNGNTADKGSTDDIAIIVTADETGTALTTDTGGGTIVANRLSATTYGRGCAGVYCIGADESLVYVFNSALHSNADAALCSASAGYIFAFNTELTGVAGIKTRSGGSGTLAGITVDNSKVVCAFNPDNYSFYDLSTDEDSWDDASAFSDWSWGDDTSLVNAQMLNLFINKTSYQFGQDISKEQSYWYQDKNTAPQTGEAMAVILCTGTATVTSNSNYFYNENYAKYASEGAKNYLLAADNAGTGLVTFNNQNSSTKWDLTGASDETTELNGDIYIASTVTMTGPDAGSGPSSANVTFNNSEWDGKVVGYLRNASLAFDDSSVWTVTGDTGVGDLTLASSGNVKADSAVTVKVYGTLTIAGKQVTEDTTIGNVTFHVGAQSVYFSDSDFQGYEWSATYADDLAAEGIIAAGTFTASSSVTRAELVETLYQAAGAPAVDGSLTYTDVDASSSYANAVIWAETNGIVSGTSTETFDPDGIVDRETAITMVYRAFSALSITAETSEGDPLSSFSDSASVSDWAEAAVNALAGMNIIVGNGAGALNPEASVTWAELSSIISKALDHVSSGMGMMPAGMA
ncbi:MAG: hypothetical protein H6Q60_358 [Oscillospiraceae bacterium]|nr:hypothetical protein [Oscillospiraceae bacterium]